MCWACVTYGERRGAYRVLRERCDGKKPLGRTSNRNCDNIKMDIKSFFVQLMQTNYYKIFELLKIFKSF